MGLKKFSDEVLSKFSKEITDQVFLSIQNDRELMHEYLRLISKEGIDSVNQHIGKSVKSCYKLSNSDSRQDNPKSMLIKSHQEFE